MNGGILDKKRGNSNKGTAPFRKEGYEGPAHPLPTIGRCKQGGVKQLFSQNYLKILYMSYIRSEVYTSSGIPQCEF
jgi:hypothetical protein